MEGTKEQSSSLFRMFVWAVTLGAVGFICGFTGPLIFNPEANQGPMLGLFITGPISTLLGILLGRITVSMGLSSRANAIALVVASIVVAGVTLSRSMPEPRYVGSVVDAEVRGCKQPKDLIADKVAWWKKTKDEPSGWSKRSDWETDIDRMIKKDAGVVLDMWVYRERKLYEQRKPWNRGRIEPTPWKEVNKGKIFYARFSGTSCSMYKSGLRQLYSLQWEESRVSPPNILPTFLGLFVLEPVFNKYQTLIGK